MVEITDHKANVCNQGITITADARDPKNGNASHHYLISWAKTFPHVPGSIPMAQCMFVDFQEGPIKEFGVNGVTNEAFIAIVIDRLRGFQSGPYACRENALALTKLEEGLMWLAQRTRLRELRGVEGTSAV